MDVARKLTILARLAAQGPTSTPLPTLPDGFASIETESLIPPPLDSITDGDEFLARLAEHDADFARLRDEAEAADEVIRYVGRIDRLAGVIKCGLQRCFSSRLRLSFADADMPPVRYPSTHPVAALAGSDNIVSFHTRRYCQRPLIVQGPADHTAAGVLADAFRVAELTERQFDATGLE